VTRIVDAQRNVEGRKGGRKEGRVRELRKEGRKGRKEGREGRKGRK
jgi:hypothetical protein